MIGLCCCTGCSLVAASRGHAPVAVHGLLIVVASLVVEHGLQNVQASAGAAQGLGGCSSGALKHRLNSYGAWAQLLCNMWDLPRPEIEPVSPALAGRFLTTGPPGKSRRKDFENTT